MTTIVDIANRALIMIGQQRRITSSLAQDSAEAQTINAVVTPIQNWCFGIANWNFARKTSALTLGKGPPPSGPGTWSTTYPSPPWLYEHLIPSDYIRAIYVTNSDPATAVAGYLGEPKRFVIGNDTISSVQQLVVLSNQASPVLIYTGFVTDPTVWPWYFERLVVIALAQAICVTLTSNPQLLEELNQMLEQQINIATQMNGVEGLIIDDSTPEWIQALGINYPYRRLDGRIPSVMPGHPRRGGGAEQ